MKGGTQASQRSEPGAGTLKAVAVVLYIVCAVLIVLERYASGPLLIPELIGSVLAPIIFTALIVWIARRFNRATSPRGAAKVAVAMMALFAVGSCGGLLTATGATGEASGASAASGGNSRAALVAKRSAAEVQDALPKKVDSVTWLRSVTAVGDTIAYWYQLTNMTASELDPRTADAFRAQLVDRVCTNASVRGRLLSQGVVIRYHYADSVDTAMTSFDVTDDDCSRTR